MAKATVCEVEQPTEMLVQLIITLEGVFLIAYQIQLLRKTQLSKTNHLILWREITQQKEITDLALIGTLLTIINLDKLDPQIIILLGSTAMEAVMASNNKVSDERGQWKEIILKNKTYPLIVTFSPSYLIRFPDKKKYSWEDLKKIRQKMKDLSIKI